MGSAPGTLVGQRVAKPLLEKCFRDILGESLLWH